LRNFILPVSDFKKEQIQDTSMEDKSIQLKMLVAQNQLGEALINALHDMTIDNPDSFNELVLMAMIYHRIKDRIRKSVITHEEGDTRLNCLAKNFLCFLDTYQSIARA